MAFDELRSAGRRHALTATASTVAAGTALTVLTAGTAHLDRARVPVGVSLVVIAVIAAGLWTVAVALLPLERVGEHVRAHLPAIATTGRLRNVAEEVALSLGRRPADVVVAESPIPNVGGLPTSDGTVVFATAGAVDQLARDELEALVAAQFAGHEDRWCRLATRAELVWSLVLAGSALSVVWALAGWVVIVPMVFLARTVEHARDLCADVAAVASTRHPDALARAMRRLSAFAPVAHQLRLSPLRSFVNPFVALTTRRPSRTSVSRSGGPTRSWTSADEITMELRLRADRAAALAAGADPSRFTGREFRRRWYRLGLDQQHDADSRPG